VTRLVTAVLVLVALLAPVLAAANVPDPTWIPGMYDGGDADEILALVWDETPAIAAIPPALLEPPAVVIEPASPGAPSAPFVTRAAASRAPPLD
jgi:hypothetical protein